MNNLIQSHKQHQNWLMAIEIIHELNELCLHIRSHRGTSTAQLEGDKFFESFTEKTAQTISEKLVDLDERNSIFSSFEAEDAFFVVVQQWLKIQLHWRQWYAYKNFSKHSDLLADIHKLICQISDYYIKQQRDESDSAELAYFLFHPHIKAMESIAKIRGLGCFTCAKQYVSAEDKKVLRTEIKQFYLLWSQRNEAFMQLPLLMQSPLIKDADARQLNAFIADFIHLTEPLVMHHPAMPNATEIFNAGSCILNIMNMQFNLGLEQLKEYFPDELQQWVNQQEDFYRLVKPL